ncbi:MAG: M20/M25/M40 family metallo-hydrolase, partial [Gemmatimonadota bacterium]
MRRALLALALPVALTAQNAPALTRWQAQARDLLKELVEINTTHSTGSTVAAAEAMARRMRAAGFPEQDVVVVENAPRKGNLVVRYRGRNPNRKPILHLSHNDVVEANPEDWTLPPFQLIERDGTIFGRGVADDKDEGAIHLTLLLRMKAEGYVPDRDIIVALTADEEGGSANGVDYLVRNRPDLIQAEFAFNEGGGGRVEEGRRVANETQASEKKVAN